MPRSPLARLASVEAQVRRDTVAFGPPGRRVRLSPDVALRAFLAYLGSADDDDARARVASAIGDERAARLIGRVAVSAAGRSDVEIAVARALGARVVGAPAPAGPPIESVEVLTSSLDEEQLIARARREEWLRAHGFAEED